MPGTGGISHLPPPCCGFLISWLPLATAAGTPHANSLQQYSCVIPPGRPVESTGCVSQFCFVQRSRGGPDDLKQILKSQNKVGTKPSTGMCHSLHRRLFPPRPRVYPQEPPTTGQQTQQMPPGTLHSGQRPLSIPGWTVSVPRPGADTPPKGLKAMPPVASSSVQPTQNAL